MSDQEFRLLKERLYRAKNAMELILESTPDLENLSIELPDGHRLLPAEVLAWLEAARSNCWRFGPADLQRRRLNEILGEQPVG